MSKRDLGFQQTGLYFLFLGAFTVPLSRNTVRNLAVHIKVPMISIANAFNKKTKLK